MAAIGEEAPAADVRKAVPVSPYGADVFLSRAVQRKNGSFLYLSHGRPAETGGSPRPDGMRIPLKRGVRPVGRVAGMREGGG